MRDTVLRLSSEIDRTLGDLLPHGTPFALLDYPDYPNVGDNAIYLGTSRFFARAGLRPAFACIPEKTDWDELQDAIGSGPIFLSGGGNFGDLYDWAQDYREEVLRRFPGRPVIQLPQTIHFRSPARIERAARAIERHDAFVLCVRDEPSLALARRHFPCETRLCPDMAFAIGPLKRGRSTDRLLLLLRDDEESAVQRMDATALPDDAVLADWPTDPADFYARTRRRVLLPASIAARKGRPAGRARVLQALAEARVSRGARLLSRGQAVITDRLHGHIICTLLDIPHVFVDNSYGKIGAFAASWTTQNTNAVAASTLADAYELSLGLV